MSASPAVRSLRAAVFAVVCVLLAVAGHRLGTGVAPPVWAGGAAFLGVFGVGFVLGGRERSLLGIGAAMLGTQGVLHIVFETVGPYGVPGAAGDGMGRDATTMGAQSMGPHAMGSGPFTAGVVAHVHEMGTPVTAAHLLAALLAAWWLRRGEAAVWGLLRHAARAVPALAGMWRLLAAPVALPAGPPGVPCAAARPVPLRQSLLRHTVRRRGPPSWVPYVS
ncbi:hypothetical protein [Streptomyces sp. NPDC047000]|uniref:hypothetical protein n=1 Tax=Streptomyces sp. NPDC047000 TaxID=3155474 RepID=UPI0033CF61F4